MKESAWKHTPGQTAELWRKIEALETENAELKRKIGHYRAALEAIKDRAPQYKLSVSTTPQQAEQIIDRAMSLAWDFWVAGNIAHKVLHEEAY